MGINESLLDIVLSNDGTIKKCALMQGKCGKIDIRKPGDGKNGIYYAYQTQDRLVTDDRVVGDTSTEKVVLVDSPAVAEIVEDEVVIQEAIPAKTDFSDWYNMPIGVPDGNGGYIDTTMGAVIEGALVNKVTALETP